MNKQLELNLSTAIDQRNNVKKRIKDNIENGNYTLDELESIYRHIYVSTEKSQTFTKKIRPCLFYI